MNEKQYDCRECGSYLMDIPKGSVGNKPMRNWRLCRLACKLKGVVPINSRDKCWYPIGTFPEFGEQDEADKG